MQYLLKSHKKADEEIWEKFKEYHVCTRTQLNTLMFAAIKEYLDRQEKWELPVQAELGIAVAATPKIKRKRKRKQSETNAESGKGNLMSTFMSGFLGWYKKYFENGKTE